MANITYYVVVPFEQNEEGDIVMLDPVEARSADSARSRVRLLAGAGRGGVAFSRMGDPELGTSRTGDS